MKRILNFICSPLNPELEAFAKKALRGEVPELNKGNKHPTIFDDYGDKGRLRTPWGKDGLEKSHHISVGPNGKIKVVFEGFFQSDKHDWPR